MKVGRARQAMSLLLAIALLLPGIANAINCTITLNPLSFGMYTPAGTVPLDAVSDITVRCVAQPGSYSVSIGPGFSGNQLLRTMLAGGADILNYNLFRDPARTQIWGDGTPPTFVAPARSPRTATTTSSSRRCPWAARATATCTSPSRAA